MKKIIRRKRSPGGKDTKKRKLYGKIKRRDLGRLTKRRSMSSNRLRVIVRARVSWEGLQI